MINEKVFEGLNPDQEKAARHIFGPCYVAAGPGAGKSATIVRKVANAINNGIEPSSIIIFTFTNKAAREIRERVEDYVGEKARQMTIGTYHSVCVRILRQYIHHLGYNKNFTILDAEDVEKILSELCKNTPLDSRSIMSYISDQKRNMIDYQTAIQNGIGINAKRAEVYRNYELRLRAQNSLDFDNIIILTIKLLSQYKDIQEKIHARYNMLYCDEFHDSSSADLELIYLLANSNQNITMIFDDDQSIYGFRGANLQAVINFKNRLHGTQEFVLKQNYRSSQTIVKASRSLIERNTLSLKKELFSANDIGDKIIYAEEQSGQAEALKIISFIKLMRQEQYDVNYGEMAILYRTNAQSFEIEKALLMHNIPYRLYGRVNFYSRKEIKDIMSYLKFAFNPYDYEAFKRAINIPKRGIGTASIQKIYDYACENNLDLLTTLENAKAIGLSKKATNGMLEFHNMVSVLRNAFLFSPPIDALNYIIEETKYYDYLEGDTEKQAKIENVMQLQSLSASYVNIEEMLEQSSLQTTEESEDEDKISLMTMHTSKGLEWKTVYIAGMNEELCPFIKAIETQNIEEERRLAYVAITRAKQYLFITRSRSMVQNGRFKPMKESRFIKEIASEYIFKIPPTKAKQV